MWGERGASCEVVYSASKSALIGYTKALAKEVGLSGITVNCVLPGVIDTDMNKHLTKQDLDELASSTSLGRIGKAEEVADLIYYLASENSSFITGQVIGVDGGFIG
jgi:3-oxoacyl-[acyl-carrier protein] reductase